MPHCSLSPWRCRWWTMSVWVCCTVGPLEKQNGAQLLCLLLFSVAPRRVDYAESCQCPEISKMETNPLGCPCLPRSEIWMYTLQSSVCLSVKKPEAGSFILIMWEGSWWQDSSHIPTGFDEVGFMLIWGTAAFELFPKISHKENNSTYFCWIIVEKEGLGLLILLYSDITF